VFLNGDKVMCKDVKDRPKNSLSFTVMESLAGCVFPGIKNVAISVAVLR